MLSEFTEQTALGQDMYESHFGFHRAPFPVCQGQHGFFISDSIRKVLPPLLHTLRSDLGIAVVTGPPGCGKTTLLRHLRHQLKLEGRVVVCSAAALETPTELHVALANAASQQAGSETDADLRQSTVSPSRWQVLERLQRSRQLWGPVMLLVDDAHLLSVPVLNEMRAYTDETATDSSQVRCLLAGPLSLEDELARPSHADISGRIRCHVFLQSLTPQESMEYLRHQLQLVGAELNSVFALSAQEELIVAAGGMTRCLNLLADESLMVAVDQQLSVVDRDCVLSALQRLQHLPYEWNIVSRRDETPTLDIDDTSSAPTALPTHPTAQARYEVVSPGVIEFGSDDLPATPVDETANSMNTTRPSADAIDEAVVTEQPEEYAEAVDRENWVDVEFNATDSDSEQLEIAEVHHYEIGCDEVGRNEIDLVEVEDVWDELLPEAVIDDGENAVFRYSNNDPFTHDLQHCDPVVVFDRYTWIELGREIPEGDQVSFTGHHHDLLTEYQPEVNLLTGCQLQESIPLAVCTDQDIISSLLKNSPTDSGREFYLRRYSQLISAAEDSATVMEVAEDLVAILTAAAEAVTEAEAEAEADTDTTETEDAVTIPFRSGVAASGISSRRSVSSEAGTALDGTGEDVPHVARLLADLQQVQESIAELSQPAESSGAKASDSVKGRFDLLFTRLNDLREKRE